MMIPIPLLMWLSVVTGQPVVIVILPGEMPKYELQAPVTQSDAGCRTITCKV